MALDVAFQTQLSRMIFLTGISFLCFTLWFRYPEPNSTLLATYCHNQGFPDWHNKG